MKRGEVSQGWVMEVTLPLIQFGKNWIFKIKFIIELNRIEIENQNRIEIE